MVSLHKQRRHLFKKKVRLSRERVRLHVEIVKHPDATTLTALYSLFCQTYEKSQTRFERLNLRFFELIAAEPVASFIVLREAAGGEPVAFMLCLEIEGKMINKFIGIDYRRSRPSARPPSRAGKPGMVLSWTSVIACSR